MRVTNSSSFWLCITGNEWWTKEQMNKMEWQININIYIFVAWCWLICVCSSQVWLCDHSLCKIVHNSFPFRLIDVVNSFEIGLAFWVFKNIMAHFDKYSINWHIELIKHTCRHTDKVWEKERQRENSYIASIHWRVSFNSIRIDKSNHKSTIKYWNKHHFETTTKKTRTFPEKS